MKKLWLIIASCAGMLQAYTPVQGPLTFSDTPNNFGAIRATVCNNPELRKELNIINQFVATLPPFAQTYQGIVEEIIQSQSPLALQTLKAFENVIMYMYHKKAFVFKIPVGTDFTFQGIRGSWLNPLSYFKPKSWIGDNNAELDQLLSELEELGKIAQGKDGLTSFRILAKVHMYRHWRKYVLTGLLSYLTYDRASRKWQDTALYQLVNDYNYTDAINIMINDAKDAGGFAFKQANKTYNLIVNFLNRKEIRAQKAKALEKENTKNRWISHIFNEVMPLD